jgi:predicted nucleic acid-binding protein
MLDSGPLGMLAHPRPNREIVEWLQKLLLAKVPVVIPEIADYEIRRSLLLHNLTQSITRLDQLKSSLLYLPLNSQTMLKAAEFWADARKKGHPTADPKELDGDVILAAQALQVGAIVATENVGHLSLFIEAKYWKDIEDIEDVTLSN